jgi:hypothetical protein
MNSDFGFRGSPRSGVHEQRLNHSILVHNISQHLTRIAATGIEQQDMYEMIIIGAGDLSVGKKGGSINLAFNMAADAMRHICTCPLPTR